MGPQGCAKTQCCTEAGASWSYRSLECPVLQDCQVSGTQLIPSQQNSSIPTGGRFLRRNTASEPTLHSQLFRASSRSQLSAPALCPATTAATAQDTQLVSSKLRQLTRRLEN